MSDWWTHLYCANKVNEKIGYAGVQKDLFLYGNILPDINPGWLIEPETQIDQSITHFEIDWCGQGYFWVPQRFFEEYMEKDNKVNPLKLGYLFHIWLDVSFMTEFMSRVPVSDTINRGFEVREWKWKDNEIFIKKYPQQLSIENIFEVVNIAKEIKEINVTRNDLLKVPAYLEEFGRKRTNDEYHVFDEKSLSDFYEKLCDDFTKWAQSLIKQYN